MNNFLPLQAPRPRAGTSVRGMMADVLIALLPIFGYGVYLFGPRVLTLTAISVLAHVLFDLGAAWLCRRAFVLTDLSAVVSGVLLAMMLPVSAPLWMPVVGAAFSMVVAKQLFGGLGRNIVNPTVAAYAFLLLAWPNHLCTFVSLGEKPNAWTPVFRASDLVSSATPLTSIGSGAESSVSHFDLILGSCTGAIGEVSALLIAAALIYLCVRRVIAWQIPLAFVGTVALLTYLTPPEGTLALNFMLFQTFSGGLCFGAVFMATDPVTTPSTRIGKWIFGVGCGLLTVFLRYFGAYSEGVAFAILLMNLLVFPMDHLRAYWKQGGKTHAKA